MNEAEILARIEREARALIATGDPLMRGQYMHLLGRATAMRAVHEGGQIETMTSAQAFPSFRLDGLVALVTGGSGGLGALGGHAFAEAGADVVLAARNRAKCEDVAGRIRTGRRRRALAMEADVTNEASVAALIERAKAEFGRIDILFNNAGVISPRSLLELELDEWHRVLDVSATGAFLCSRAVAPLMIEQGCGRIINMGSILSEHGIANRAAYCAAKAAMANLGRAMAVELGPHGITVNTIAPSVIVTDLNRHLVDHQPQVYGKVLDRMPLGRLGQPEDLAGALVFLASPASAFITGQVLHVDGGFDAT